MGNKTRFYNRQVAESLSTPHHIISIGEQGDGWKIKPCHTNVIRLLFQDIQEYIDEQHVLFSADQALLIIKWLQAIPDDSLVIAHCEGGVARSAAVVKFMIDKMGYEFEPDRYCREDYSLMNVFVYKRLVEQYDTQTNR